MRKPELLSPAGDFERLEYALSYGADACYLAGKDFGMRTARATSPARSWKRPASWLIAWGNGCM